MTKLQLSTKRVSPLAEPTLFCRIPLLARKRAVLTLFWQFCLTLLAIGAGCPPLTLADALPEFAYRTVNVQCMEPDVKPVCNGSIYGFCR